MKENRAKTPLNHEKKRINIGALIVCFFIACGIWIYAQAIDDDINVKTYNQLPIEVIGNEKYKAATGFDVYSLNVQYANISINGTNRELVKYDAQSVRLIADVGTANNNVASIHAYYVDEKGEKTELKNYQVTPAVVTVNICKQIDYTISFDYKTENYKYDVDASTTNGKLSLIGPEHELRDVAYVQMGPDYQSIRETSEVQNISVASMTFYDAEGNVLFNDSNKNESIKYDTSGIYLKVTGESLKPAEPAQTTENES